MIKYYLLDTETSGLKAGYNEILQISTIRYDDKFQFSINVKPEYPDRITGDVLRILNKYRSELIKGTEKAAAVDYIDSMFQKDGLEPKNRCIIAHNAQFDMRFCHAMWASVGKSFPADMWLCSLGLSKKYADTIGRDNFASKQGLLKPKFGLDMCLAAINKTPKEGQHNAVVDTENLNSLVEYLFDKNINHVSLIKNVPHRIGKVIDYDISDF